MTINNLPKLSDDEIKDLRASLDETLEVLQVALAQIKKHINDETK